MSYKINLEGNNITLNLFDHVDLSETGQIKEEMARMMENSFTKMLIVGDKLAYIDSSAVALLLFLKRVCDERAGLFQIESLSDIASKVIHLAGLASILTLKNEAALRKEKGNTKDLDQSLDDLFSDM